MVILSHYFLIHNKPRSHYRLIYTISLPRLRQLNGAEGFLRSRLTDLPLICTMAPRPPIGGTSKPPTTRAQTNVPTAAALLWECRLLCGRLESERSEQDKGGRSECGSLEAGGDNRGEETQVTPAEWRAVA